MVAVALACGLGCMGRSRETSASDYDRWDEGTTQADDSQPSGWFQAAPLRARVRPGDDVVVGVWIDVPDRGANDDIKRSVAFVVDTSGSMAGEKMSHAKRAAHGLLDGLDEDDRAGLYSFSTTATRQVRMGLLESDQRRRFDRAVDELYAHGDTAMFSGVRMAESDLDDRFSRNDSKQILLISDGLANVGPASPRAFRDFARDAGDRGSQFTALGVGYDYDHRTLNALVEQTAGRLYHVDDARDLGKVVRDELEHLKRIAASNAYIDLVPGPGVEIIDVDGARADRRQRGVRVPLGTLYGGQRKELLVRIRTSRGRGSAASLDLLHGDLRFTDPRSQDERARETFAKAAWTDGGDPGPAHPRVASIAASHQAARAQARAEELLGNEQYAEAERAIADAQTQLAAQGKGASSAEERARVDEASRRLARSKEDVDAAAAAPAASRPAAAKSARKRINDSAMDAYGY